MYVSYFLHLWRFNKINKNNCKWEYHVAILAINISIVPIPLCYDTSYYVLTYIPQIDLIMNWLVIVFYGDYITLLWNINTTLLYMAD